VTKTSKKKVRDFLKQFGVRVHFVKQGWSSANGEKSLIEIDIREATTRSMMWSVVFHELSHIICYRKGLYKKYHHETLPPKKMAIYMRRYGLRVERFVDCMASKMMHEYFPKMKFVPTYCSKADVEWYKKWVKRTYPLKGDK